MNFRLLPLLGISASALLGLKVLGLVLGPDSSVLQVREAMAQEAEGPAEGGEASAPMPDMAAAEDPLPPVEDDEDAPVLPESLEIGGSAAERAVLESLGKRRQVLEGQEGQLDLREKLLQATEERIQKRVDELKALEKRIEGVVEEKRMQDESEIAGLVTMYENMKPKDAARIFNRLDMPVLIKVVRQMKPRKMAAILGKMSPDAAERLTVEMAGVDEKDEPVQAQTQADLPKIRSN